jgi:dTDP-4-dehydrorhamnose 3,5-epimerase
MRYDVRTPNPNPPKRSQWKQTSMEEEGIRGVIARELTKHEDERGWLLELYREDELPPLQGANPRPVMAYISCTGPRVQRGPHEHMDQTDVFVFISGTFMIELWDNRPESPTYKNRLSLCAGDGIPALVVVPPGVVHAYVNLDEEPGLVFNGANALFKGENRQDPVDEIRHELNRKSPFCVDLLKI